MRTALVVLALGVLPCCGPRVARPASAATVGARALEDWDPALLRRAGVDPEGLRCNHDQRWGAVLKGDSEAGADEILAALGDAAPAGDARPPLRKRIARLLFWRMVRAVLLEGDNNNLGALPLRGRTWTDRDGTVRPVLIFRSGITPHPEGTGSCFASLLAAGRVRHVVNLFDGDLPVADLVAAEAAAAARAGASYRSASDDPEGYGPWRDLLRTRYEDAEARARAMAGVARLIREQIIAPGGAAPTGNLHIHCGGGMHRSGMVAGVIERCVNGTPIEIVEAHYRFHVGWRDAAHPGGAEENNLRFLRDFDCALLR